MITLLNLQAKLAVLEGEFRDICYQDDISSIAEVKEYSTYFLKLHGAQASNDAQFKKLGEIREAKKEYYDLLTRSAQVAQLSRPENHQVCFLRDWLEGEQEGKDFLKLKEHFTWHSQYQEDFVTLVSSKAGSITNSPTFPTGLEAVRSPTILLPWTARHRTRTYARLRFLPLSSTWQSAVVGLRHSPGIYAAHPSSLDPLLRAPNSRQDRHNHWLHGIRGAASHHSHICERQRSIRHYGCICGYRGCL
jgi:hypothetical protein